MRRLLQPGDVWRAFGERRHEPRCAAEDGHRWVGPCRRNWLLQQGWAGKGWDGARKRALAPGATFAPQHAAQERCEPTVLPRLCVTHAVPTPAPTPQAGSCSLASLRCWPACWSCCAPAPPTASSWYPTTRRRSTWCRRHVPPHLPVHSARFLPTPGGAVPCPPTDHPCRPLAVLQLCRDRGYPYVRLDGTTTIKKRNKLVRGGWVGGWWRWWEAAEAWLAWQGICPPLALPRNLTTQGNMQQALA